MNRAVKYSIMHTTIVVLMLFQYGSASAQCPEARSGWVTINLFDLNSTDIAPQEMQSFLSELTFKLNAQIRGKLQSHGLLGDSRFEMKWCPGMQISDAKAAVSSGKKTGSAGVLWGDIDQGSGIWKSALRMTSVARSPITGLSNISYRGDTKSVVDASFIAFASYIVGKMQLEKKQTNLAKRNFNFARSLKSLPDQIESDLDNTISSLDASSSARKLTSISRGEK